MLINGSAINAVEINGSAGAGPTSAAASTIGRISTFGTPNAVAVQPATGFSSTSFGTPAHPHPQTATATGWEVTGMGRPVAGTYTPFIVNRTVSATTLRPVKFGLAAAAAQVSAQASGQTSTAFGSPTSRRAQSAQSLAPTVTFGLPSASAGTRAAGFRAPSFGTPTARTTHRAASVYRATRWGLPTAERSNTYKVRGIDLRARFGQPAAHRLNAYRATAGAPTTQFGTPVATPRYRAFHLPPETRFGKPRLIRSPAC